MSAGTACARMSVVMWTVSCLLAVAALTPSVGCQRRPADQPADRLELAFTPSPPTTGDVVVTLTLSADDGTPMTGAEARLEGNMNHAGMKPSFADLDETAPGRYTGTLNFTMGGDWYVMVTATFPDGRRLERKIDVPGVTTP